MSEYLFLSSMGFLVDKIPPLSYKVRELDTFSDNLPSLVSQPCDISGGQSMGHHVACAGVLVGLAWSILDIVQSNKNFKKSSHHRSLCHSQHLSLP